MTKAAADSESPKLQTRRLGPRAALLILLAAAELPFLAFLYDPLAINDADPLWLTARTTLREFVPLAVFFLAALAVLATPNRKAFADRWRKAAQHHAWIAPVVLNGLGFFALSFATIAFNRFGARLADPPWALFALWAAAVGVLYLVLALAFAPYAFWRKTVGEQRALIALAAGAAILVEAAAVLSRQSWSALSEATFRVSAALLGLYEKDVIVEPARRVLGAGDFKVNIAAACSGYEGIGLVLTFLGVYLYVFRSVLRFPNVYLTLPLGAAAIWILNSVRIALLVSLGAHVSPDIAITGFHSQAGWMMFLIVTIAIMAATHRIDFFHNRRAEFRSAAPSPAFREAIALLAPFLAMTAAGIVAAAFSGKGEWFYALRVIAIVLALLSGWRFYVRLDWRAGWEPIALGLIVGAAWIATDPNRAAETALGSWLSSLSPAASAVWLLLRILGMVLLVPIAEELAFRGYLHRKLIADKFETVREGAFSWKAFLVTSILFGAIHERWLAGALSGVVFALALYRSRKVSGAVIAHIAANAVIAFWALAFGAWGLF